MCETYYAICSTRFVIIIRFVIIFIQMIPVEPYQNIKFIQMIPFDTVSKY